jgi:hypothetical protein
MSTDLATAFEAALQHGAAPPPVADRCVVRQKKVKNLVDSTPACGRMAV